MTCCNCKCLCKPNTVKNRLVELRSLPMFEHSNHPTRIDREGNMYSPIVAKDWLNKEEIVGIDNILNNNDMFKDVYYSLSDRHIKGLKSAMLHTKCGVINISKEVIRSLFDD